MNPVFQHATTPLEPGVTVIAASAGTGKTFTLAALVVRLIAEHGIPIQRLLLTTYTVAATAELRERIRARLIDTLNAIEADGTDDEFLSALLPQLPTEAAERVRNAIRDFDEASIFTIHGFCQRALREQAFETGTPFDPEILTNATALFTEVAEDYWRRHVYPASPVVAAAIAYSDLSPASLLKPLRDAGGRSALRAIPSGSEFDAAAKTVAELFEEFRIAWPSWRDTLQRVLVVENDWGNKHHRSADLERALATLETAAAPGASSVALLQSLKVFCHLTTASLSDGTNKRKRKQPLEHSLFTLCDRFAVAIANLRDALIAHFLAWSRPTLEQRKADSGILLFDDLLTRLHQALEGPNAASTVAQLGGRFDAVLVDEFQDTDSIQAEIFLRLFATSRHRLFLIGDPKQAIYGFRGADLFAYLQAVETSPRHYTLRQNQRSSTAMVAAVNQLFSRPPQPFLDPRIPFEPVEAAGRADKTPLLLNGQPRAPFHFWFWKSDERLGASKAREELPVMVAAEVARLLGSGAVLGDRPVQPGDCAVLCRNNRQARAMADALARQGVPAVVMSNANVFEAPEAGELRLILASLAEPVREPLLRSALTCPALGYTMAELLAIETAPEDWEQVRQRWQLHHERWRDHGFIRMFREFLRVEQIRPRLLARPDGERRLTNLQHLAELLHTAAENQHLGPTGVMHWLDQQMAPGTGAEETELRLDRDDSAVRVVTIHKSKGLEYPIVFCPFLWAQAGLREKEPLLFHDANGDLVLDLRSERDPAHTARAENERLAEEIRLLYVALTRAKYECHVVWGPFGNGAKKLKDPEVSALMRFLEPPTGDPTFAALVTHTAACSPMKLESTIGELCATWPTLYAQHSLPVDRVPRFGVTTGAIPTLRPRMFARRIDATWRSSSYSSLTAGHQAEFDEHAPDRLVIDEASLQGMHAFPRGAKPGSCLHDILQHLDYAAGNEATRELLTHKLRQHAMFSDERLRALEEMIAHMRQVLPAGALQRSNQLRELEFHLPAGMLSPTDLTEFAGTELSFDRRRGILKGYIDLVFEHEGRFYVLDWKSNWLGSNTADYTTEAMNTEMRRFRYNLQRQIYSFALHRFLQVRLANYEPERHMGGAYYVFLRGLDRVHPERGIVRTPANVTALHRMERLFPKP
jgi:exodeoxyribonuclease V beta subunit